MADDSNNGEPDVPNLSDISSSEDSKTTSTTNRRKTIRHASIKPPVFTEETASAWFRILEAQFRLTGISATRTRFYNALAALPATTVAKLEESTLTSEDYTILRKAVTQMGSKSQVELFNSFLAEAALLDKPSTFVRELSETAKKLNLTNADNLIRHKLLQQVPISIAPVLAAQKALSLQDLAKLADDLAAFGHASTIAATTASNTAPNFRRRPAEENQPLSKPSCGLRPFSSAQRQKICRFHIFFGKDARKCTPWCQWPAAKPQLASRQSSRASSPIPGNPQASL